MKKILLLLLLALLIHIPVFSEDSWSGSSLPDGGKELRKTVSLDLSGGTKKAVVGFSNRDIAFSEESGNGAFADVSNYVIRDAVSLEIALEDSFSDRLNKTAGNAYYGLDENGDGNFYIFYQFVSSNDITVYLKADGPLTADDESRLDFIVRGASSNGKKYIDTSDGTGTDDNNLVQVHHHPTNERYAWADGMSLIIETVDADLLKQSAKSYRANLIAVVQSE